VSLTTGQFAFLPWIRTGAGAQIERVDGSAGTTPRVSVPVKVRFNGDPALADGVTLELFGPGEVTTFDTRTIVRRWPRPGVMDAESNYFPLVELDQADLPWRYTPASATPGDRLTPWIALIVLEDAEIESLVLPSDDGHLGTVEIVDAKVLPASGQLWAWAHAQVSGETKVDQDRVAQLMAAQSRSLRSRLVAARRLQPHHGYRAFIVPVFKRGVMRGLGQDPGAIDALERAWTDTPGGPLTLPFYDHWRFGTGPDGDFETLARMIEPFEAPQSLGIRDMDVSAASPGFPTANAVPLGLRGMLTALDTPDTPWPTAARQPWIAKLKALLNLPAARTKTPGTPLTVTPPLYGQWPAATDTCTADVPPERPLWFQELAVDPRLRTGAGLGTRVVQKHQEELMASAWDQVDRVRQLNEELRQAQLARAMAERLAKRHLQLGGDPLNVVTMTAPLHARIKASPTTVRAVLQESPIPRGLWEGAFRRLTRPLGPVGRRQAAAKKAVAGAPAPRPLLERLNAGTVSAAKPPGRPSEMNGFDKVAASLAPAGTTAQTAADVGKRGQLLQRLGWLALLLAIVLLLVGLWPAALALGAVGAGLVVIGRREAGRAVDLGRRLAVRDGALSGSLVREATPPETYVPTEAPAAGAPRTLPGEATGAQPAPPQTVAALQRAFATMLDTMAPPTQPGPVLKEAPLAKLAATLSQKLDPRLTIPRAYDGRFTLDAGTRWQPDDPLEPILAAPEFPQPMYKPLADLNSAWLLPGFEKIPPNSATLLKSNQRMIEAYMVGLNHEMARELLWREYPTTQRATYFRQFWDTAGYTAPEGQALTPDQLKDIVPIHTWRPPTDLGQHSPRPPLPGQQGATDYLVLFIRGDVLRRYPQTEVYAVKAKWGTDGREIDDPANDGEIAAKIAHPLFSGMMEPDANFFGFALTKEQVLGDGVRNGQKPGWYFVLAEPSGEPRFGMDEPAAGLADAQFGLPVTGADWNDLGWANMAGSRAGVDALLAVNLNAPLPDTTAVTDATTRAFHADQGPGQHGSRSSDLAYITLQRPMRLAIHASEMIP
jgi:hypothetical protein